VYNLATDMKKSKFFSGQKLEQINLDVLPNYLKDNKLKYIDWLE